MKYKITNNYCFHNGIIVDMYFVQGIPFTFDDIDPALQDDPYVNIEAENTTAYSTEDLYKWSGYQCKRMSSTTPLELENPEALPQDGPRARLVEQAFVARSQVQVLSELGDTEPIPSV